MSSSPFITPNYGGSENLLGSQPRGSSFTPYTYNNTNWGKSGSQQVNNFMNNLRSQSYAENSGFKTPGPQQYGTGTSVYQGPTYTPYQNVPAYQAPVNPIYQQPQQYYQSGYQQPVVPQPVVQQPVVYQQVPTVNPFGCAKPVVPDFSKYNLPNSGQYMYFEKKTVLIVDFLSVVVESLSYGSQTMPILPKNLWEFKARVNIWNKLRNFKAEILIVMIPSEIYQRYPDAEVVIKYHLDSFASYMKRDAKYYAVLCDGLFYNKEMSVDRVIKDFIYKTSDPKFNDTGLTNITRHDMVYVDRGYYISTEAIESVVDYVDADDINNCEVIGNINTGETQIIGLGQYKRIRPTSYRPEV